jgi:hypothetical protein
LLVALVMPLLLQACCLAVTLLSTGSFFCVLATLYAAESTLVRYTLGSVGPYSMQLLRHSVGTEHLPAHVPQLLWVELVLVAIIDTFEFYGKVAEYCCCCRLAL